MTEADGTRGPAQAEASPSEPGPEARTAPPPESGASQLARAAQPTGVQLAPALQPPPPAPLAMPEHRLVASPRRPVLTRLWARLLRIARP